MRPIAIQTELRGLSVCLYVGHVREPSKMIAPIKMAIWGADL